MDAKGRILIVDDNTDLLDYLREFFVIYNYEVIVGENGAEGLELFNQYRPELVITDMRLPDITGNLVVEGIRRMDPQVPVIIITGFSDQTLIVDAMKNGAVDLLRKPFRSKDLKYLINKVETLFRKKQVSRHAEFLRWEQRSFQLVNDVHEVAPVVGLIFANLDFLAEDPSFLKVGLQEILLNAIEHGNLELTYEAKQAILEQGGDYNAFLRDRAQEERFRKRVVDIVVLATPEYARIEIRDQGPGFDPNGIPDPEDPENFLRESGKGILLAMNAWDRLQYNATGNQVTMIKMAPGAGVTVDEVLASPVPMVLPRLLPAQKVTEPKDDGGLMKLELDLAAEFQNTFLPKRSDFSGFSGIEADYLFLPLQKVSGDFIDISRLDEAIYGFFISDISGHGVAAALISSMLKVFFSLYAKDLLSPQLLFEVLNQEFYQYLNSGEYFTSFYGLYFQEQRKFVYTNANHPDPILLRADGRLEELSSEGFFVGVFRDSVFEERELLLEPGDRILFYTDGIVEARSPAGEAFGKERLRSWFVSTANMAPGHQLDHLYQQLMAYTGQHPEDDITASVVAFS